MRHVWLGLVLAVAAGCSTQAVNFEHQSELEVNTRGVALNEDGLDALVGMYGTSCVVNVSDASVGADYDFPTEEEEVQDSGRLNGELAVVVVTELGAHLSYPDRVWDDPWTEDVGGAGVLEGRIYEDGVTLLFQDRVDWYVNEDVFSTALPTDFCVGGCSFSVIGSTGDAFVANGTDVIVAGKDGAESLGEGADLAVWDATAEVLYTAEVGSSTLRGLEIDGGERWAATLDGAIVSVDDMGALGAAAVVLEHGSGTGGLVTVDGYTGEVTSGLPTPSAARDVRVSGNGRSLAMILDREVHFFGIHELP